MSTIVFAGAAQFAAVGYVASGLAWPGDRAADRPPQRAPPALLGGAVAVAARRSRFARRAVMAHLLTDESFALTITHFRRLGRTDERGYWIAAIGATFIPWNLATLAGRAPRGADPGSGAAGHRRHLPGRDDRPRGRPGHRPARAGRGHRRGRCRGRRRARLEPGHRDRRRRHPRAGGRPAGPGSSRPRPRRWAAGIGRALRDARRAVRSGRRPPTTGREPADR